MQTTTYADTVTIKITPNDTGNPPGKLADVEVHFVSDSLFAGLKLIGFSVWERRSGAGRNVTFPARQYSVNGERRSFALCVNPSATRSSEGSERRSLGSRSPRRIVTRPCLTVSAGASVSSAGTAVS